MGGLWRASSENYDDAWFQHNTRHAPGTVLVWPVARRQELLVVPQAGHRDRHRLSLPEQYQDMRRTLACIDCNAVVRGSPTSPTTIVIVAELDIVCFELRRAWAKAPPELA